jgi:N-sulfoglucosamine sulfohydrolase
VIQTPNLDRLAREGIRFTRAFCSSASCAASRSAILTGLHNHANGTYGHTHGVHHFRLFDDVPTLPALLKKGNYRTAAVGKKHYAPESLFPFDFDVPQYVFERDDVQMASACRPFIAKDGPFFLYWASWNPHRGRGPLESHPLKPDRFGNPEGSFPGDQEQVYSEEKVIVPPFMNDTPEARAELAQYYQSISRLDRGVGQLIKILKQEGKYDNTLIIYISDNGSAFPGAKTTLYEPGMRLPCIVKRPDQTEPGTVSDALVSWVDITPTVLDFAGIRWPVESGFKVHGKSIRPLLEQTDRPKDWREELYASHTFHGLTQYYPMRVVRTDRYKFIYNLAHPLTYPFAEDLWRSPTWQAILRDRPEQFGARKLDRFLHRPRFELYDLRQDPNEAVNLAERPEYQDMVETFSKKLKAFQEKTSDPWAYKWTHE